MGIVKRLILLGGNYDALNIFYYYHIITLLLSMQIMVSLQFYATGTFQLVPIRD